MSKIFVEDVGTEILINMQETLASATNIVFNIKKPDNTTTTWTPTVVSTNFLRYYIQAGDLNITGVYTIQPHMTIGSWTGSATKCFITAHEKI